MVMNDEADYAQDGNNETEDGELEVNYTITTGPEMFRSSVGLKIRLACRVAPNDGNDVVSWTKGDSSKIFFGSMRIKIGGVSDTKYTLVNGTHDLVIADLTPEDSGKYTCQVEQQFPVNVTHTLIVEQAPTIHNPETTTMDSVNNIDDISIDDDAPRIISFSASLESPAEGTDVVLTCNNSGIPEPSIIWARRKFSENFTEALSEENGEFRGAMYTLRHVNKSDSGEYFCYAINSRGNATASLSLHVHGKPHVHAHSRVINTDIGVTALIRCSTDENPRGIQWLKDDMPLGNPLVSFGTSSSTLAVTPQSDDDFGTFTCRVQNEHGSHSRSIKLVQKPVIENVAFDGNNLTWTVKSHQRLEDIVLKLRPLNEESEEIDIIVPLPSNPIHEYNLIHAFNQEDLQGNEYDLSIKVKNSKEWSEISDPIKIRIGASVAQSIQTASMAPIPSDYDVNDDEDEDANGDDDEYYSSDANNTEYGPKIGGRHYRRRGRGYSNLAKAIAKVFGGGNAACSIQAPYVLTAIMMYLLVRML